MACLLPNAAFHLAFNRIEYTEVHGKVYMYKITYSFENVPELISTTVSTGMYTSWSNLFYSGPSTLPLGYIFVMLIFDTVWYIFLAYYIGVINPGKFGAGKSPFFIFQVSVENKSTNRITVI